MPRQRCLAVLIAAFLLASCSGQGAGTTPTPGPESTPTFTPTTDPHTPTPSSNGTLVLWLVPSFAPHADTIAGSLLLSRLQEFEASHPGLSIITRIKQVSGAGGIFDTLQAAAIAAPATLPDIVTLDVQMLNAAALENLILPLDDLLAVPSAPSWYNFSIDASMIDGAHYGLPFAADAEVLAYNIGGYAAAPRTWSDLLAGPGQFLFPVADPQASFTINQYLAAGGTLANSSGDPMLELEPLIEVLSFYQSLHAAEILPLGARQYTTAAETWYQLSSGKAAAALAPLNTFFTTYYPSFTSAISLPARTSAGSVFTETWSWAIVPRDPARQNLAAELLLWLTEPEFLGAWTEALNLLPPSAGALATWPDGSKASIASRLVANARNRPADDVLDLLGPPIRDAILQVLLDDISPEDAAAEAIANLQSP